MVSTAQSVSLASSPIFIATISKRLLDPIVATGSLLGNRHLYGRNPMSDSLHTHKPEADHDHDHSHKLQPVQKKHDHGGHGDSCCSSKAAAPSLIKLSDKPTDGARLSSFRIDAMDCPTEQTLIQNKLGKLSGVQQLEFNLINRVLGVTHDLPSTAPIIEAIKSLGMQADPLESGVEAPAPAPEKKPWWPLALSGVGAWQLKSSTSPTPHRPGWWRSSR